MSRGVLTVDLDCPTCRGTGRVYEAPSVAAPGGIGRRRIRVERLCACVLPAPVYSEIDGGVSIGRVEVAVVEAAREGRT